MSQNLDLLRYRVGHGLLTLFEDLIFVPKTLPHAHMMPYYLKCHCLLKDSK